MTEYVDRSLWPERGGDATKPGNADILDKRLDTLIQRLAEVSAGLEARLQPILLSERERVIGGDVPPAPDVDHAASPMFSGLFQQVSVLEAGADRIEHLLSRIDL